MLLHSPEIELPLEKLPVETFTETETKNFIILHIIRNFLETETNTLKLRHDHSKTKKLEVHSTTTILKYSLYTPYNYINIPNNQLPTIKEPSQ